jgi:uncharacterized protein (UPF0254 family)
MDTVPAVHVVSVGVYVGVGESVGVCVCVAVLIGDGVNVGVCVGVGVDVDVAVLVDDGVKDGLGVDEGVGVDVAIGGEITHPLSNVTLIGYELGSAVKSKSNSMSTDGGLGLITRLSPVQPEVITTDGGSAFRSQIVLPSNTIYSIRPLPAGQPRLIASIVISIKVPLVIVHCIRSPLLPKPVIVIKEQLGVDVGVGVLEGVGEGPKVGVFEGTAGVFVAGTDVSVAVLTTINVLVGVGVSIEISVVVAIGGSVGVAVKGSLPLKSRAVAVGTGDFNASLIFSDCSSTSSGDIPRSSSTSSMIEMRKTPSDPTKSSGA